MAQSKYVSFDDLPLALNVDQVMKALGLNRNTVYEMIRSGQLGSIRVGHKYIIPKDSLVALLQSV